MEVSRLRLIASGVLVAGLLLLAPTAGAANPSIIVTFSTSGAVTVALPDGTPLGTTSGFVLEKMRHRAASITGATFVGTRSASVALTAGKWLVMPHAGKTTYTITVR